MSVTGAAPVGDHPPLGPGRGPEKKNPVFDKDPMPSGKLARAGVMKGAKRVA